MRFSNDTIIEGKFEENFRLIIRVKWVSFFFLFRAVFDSIEK